MEIVCLNCDRKYSIKDKGITADNLIEIKHNHYCNKNCKELLRQKIKTQPYINELNQTLTDLNYNIFKHTAEQKQRVYDIVFF
jgi:hypothetical protein